MNGITRYFLKAEDRLKSRKAIDTLFAEGKSFSIFPLRILWRHEETGDGLKAGFTASSKNFKRATDRNRIKRLMREAYRLQKHLLEGTTKAKGEGLQLFFIYSGKELPKYDVIYEKTGAALKRIYKQLHEIAE